MKRPRAQGVAQSVKDRLQHLARQEGRLYAELLLLFGLERLLYRLSRSPHGDLFVLKGALMLRAWKGVESRPTRDIDLLGPVGLNEDVFKAVVHDCIDVDVAPDGLEFDRESIVAQPIRVAARHVGLRVKLIGFLGRARLPFQIDVGTGDGVVPEPVRLTYPTLLDFPAPQLRAYTPYTAVAEKLDAIVDLGKANSRMKDYFDIDLLARSMRFEGPLLVDAITATFEARGASPPTKTPVGLQSVFVDLPGKALQWRAFLRKGHLEKRVDSFAEVMPRLREFLLSPAAAAARCDFAAREN